MKQKLIRFLPFIFIIVFLIPAMMPLFQPGFFPMHDDEQVGRLYQLDKVLQAGHIPPRLTPDLGYGYNYLLFNFYPPFVYYVAEIFVLLGFSYIVSTKLMIASGFICAAIFMYLFVKEYAGRVGGIVAAVAYSYAPYHALDVYIRGALPEFWSFVFIPGLFWSFYKLARSNNSIYLYISSLMIAGLIMTHNLVAMMSSIFLGIYVLYLLFGVSNRLRFFLQVALSGIIGLGLSAYFWIPSFIEKEYTLVNILTSDLANYNHHFVYIRQFFNSPWGFGGSLYGLYDGISFEIGKAHWVLFVLSVLIISFGFWRKKIKNLHTAALFIILFSFSLFIQTFKSSFVWDMLPPFWYIQFPWRFLLFSAFTLAFIVGYTFRAISNKNLKAIVALCFIIGLIAYNSQYFQPSEYLKTVTDEDYTSDTIIKWKTSRMAAEYVPKEIATRRTDAGYSVVDITEQEIASYSAEVVEGDITISALVDKPHYKQFTVAAETPGVLQINSYAYPGWKVTINEQPVEINDNNKFRLIHVSVPEGHHSLVVSFEDTVVRSTSNTISVITVMGILGYVLYSHRKSFKIIRSGKNK